jgi:hypothetical protein
MTSDELLKRMSREQAIAHVQRTLRGIDSLDYPDIPAVKAKLEKVLEELRLSC